jgi:hypothetical protein
MTNEPETTPVSLTLDELALVKACLSFVIPSAGNDWTERKIQALIAKLEAAQDQFPHDRRR